MAEENGRPPHPLKDARKRLGLRQKDVATEAGCSVPLVSMIESGYIPPMPLQESIAVAVQASVGSFWP